jgi:hypothetical protein
MNERKVSRFWEWSNIMITIDVTDEMEIKTEKNKTPKSRLSDIIWWGIWKNGKGTINPKPQDLTYLGQITTQVEINNGKWRI